MAEVHLIGEITCASGFPTKDLFCIWEVFTGEGWTKVEGIVQGQTQVDSPKDGNVSYFCHPIDIHYSMTSIVGWPYFKIQVWHRDFFGRNELYGYGIVHVPTKSGQQELECVTWRPRGGIMEELEHFFIGGTPHLRNEDLISSSTDRFRLETISMGKVFINLCVVHKDLKKFGVHV